MSQDIEQQQTAEAARHWVARLASGTIEEDELLRFKAWLHAAPAHQAAFADARQLWRDAAGLEAAFAGEQSRPRQWRFRHAAIAAALAASLAVVAVTGDDLATAWRADHRTGVGEQARLTLPDGSVAHLNTDSAIAIHFTAEERRVELLRGEALFEVAPNPARPFRAVARDGVSEALGTSFAVRDSGQAVTVRVLSGTVGVTSSSAGVVLRRAQQVAYRPGLPPSEVAADDASSAGAWRDGRIVIEGRSFAEAMEELDRYRSGRILVLADPARMGRVSGVFRTDQVDSAVTALAATQGLTVTRLTDRLLILR